MERYIYIINSDQTNNRKVGYTKNIYRRLSTLQSSSPNALGYETIYKLENARSAYAVEQGAHNILNSLGYHVRGEWFNCPWGEASKAITIAAENYGAPIDYGDIEDIYSKHKEAKYRTKEYRDTYQDDRRDVFNYICENPHVADEDLAFIFDISIHSAKNMIAYHNNRIFSA